MDRYTCPKSFMIFLLVKPWNLLLYRRVGCARASIILQVRASHDPSYAGSSNGRDNRSCYSRIRSGSMKKNVLTRLQSRSAVFDIFYTRRDYLLRRFASRLYFTRIVSSESSVCHIIRTSYRWLRITKERVAHLEAPGERFVTAREI